ncbi:hypothetical protein J4E93_004858 [Alternaria ventricosa]|uniref:uncharacterized protein n=1 Tax=Alternaria ventricosa TaxID=1187951 RepID=UPI0020C4316B|nr:uncharacterized protein J4E93_004858 [Alternaria ventricosa]KAI4646636.1 hypothetical protein J4E93_004858 [Alternaria ventricosa]
MKPTHNAISTEGQKIFSTTFDTIGFFARSIGDLQLLADVFCIEDDRPPERFSRKDVSVALLKTPMWSQAGSSTINAMQRTAAILRNHGVRVEEVSLPDDFGDADTLRRSQRAITNAEAKVAFLKEYRMDKANLDASICHLVENKPEHANAERMQALDRHVCLRGMFDGIAASYSAILAPSAADEAPLGLDDMGSPMFNTLWTASDCFSVMLESCH